MMTPRRISETVFLEDHYNPEFNHRKNVIDTITGKSKDFLSLFTIDSPEGNETASDDKEKKKAERYAASNKNRNLFFPDQGESVSIVNRMNLPNIMEDEALNVQDRSVQEAITVSGVNNKLWMGLDYANFIVKDLINLDSPFVGE